MQPTELVAVVGCVRTSVCMLQSKWCMMCVMLLSTALLGRFRDACLCSSASVGAASSSRRCRSQRLRGACRRAAKVRRGGGGRDALLQRRLSTWSVGRSAAPSSSNRAQLAPVQRTPKPAHRPHGFWGALLSGAQPHRSSWAAEQGSAASAAWPTTVSMPPTLETTATTASSARLVVCRCFAGTSGRQPRLSGWRLGGRRGRWRWSWWSQR